MGRTAILGRSPIRREITVQPELGQARQGEIGLGVVDELAYARLAPAGGEEALLEVEERVLPAARPAAEVELLEPVLLPPARRLEEDEVRRRRFAATLARSGDVVMQPGSGREAERGSRELVAEASLDEHDLLTQPLGERLPVVGREEVEVVGAEPAHRPLVEGREPGEAPATPPSRDLETGRPCLAHLVAVLGMKAVEEVEVGVER